MAPSASPALIVCCPIQLHRSESPPTYPSKTNSSPTQLQLPAAVEDAPFQPKLSRTKSQLSQTSWLSQLSSKSKQSTSPPTASSGSQKSPGEVSVAVKKLCRSLSHSSTRSVRDNNNGVNDVVRPSPSSTLVACDCDEDQDGGEDPEGGEVQDGVPLQMITKTKPKRKCTAKVATLCICFGVSAALVALFLSTTNLMGQLQQKMNVFNTAGDSDGDGLSDAIEQRLGLDPFDRDTDGDGKGDGEEVVLNQSDESKTGKVPKCPKMAKSMSLSASPKAAKSMSLSVIPKAAKSMCLSPKVAKTHSLSASPKAAKLSLSVCL